MIRFLALLWFLTVLLSASAQGNSIPLFHITSMPKEGIWLDKGWKFQAGDNPEWTNPAYNDKNWRDINPTKDVRALPELWKTNIGWFRLHFTIDSTVTNKNLSALVNQTGATEIYLNGQLIGSFGTISTNPKQVQAVTPPIGSFIPFPVKKAGEQVLAVRFAVLKHMPYINFAGRPNTALTLVVKETKSISDEINSDITPYFEFSRAGLFLIIAVLHLALYLFNPSQKANFYFFIYALLTSVTGMFHAIVFQHIDTTVFRMMSLIGFLFGGYIATLFLLLAVYKTFHYRVTKVFWIIVAALFLVVFTYGISYAYSYWITNLYVIAPLLEIIRITYLANRRKQRGARILVAGSISFVLLFALFNLFALGYIPAGPNWLYGHLVINTSFLSLPIALSVYLALESSYASRTLTEKLVEVQQLSQEKETILANQNETLERQVKERTAALHHSLQELKAAQKQLIHAEKMASLGELTAGIAHEIQNPLNFVNNFSETNVELLEELKLELEKGNIGEANTLITDAIENEQKITHHGRRADSIVKGMLEHSRTSSGKREPTDLNKLADEYLRLSYHGLRAKDKNFNAVIQTNFDESIGKVSIIPQDIGRVLLNLFNNAFYAVNQKKLQATEEYEPTVSISTKKSNNAIEIAVRDNGMGIPSHIIEKIFQPFFTTKPTGQGTGLGLSLSYDIVRAHGGELKVSSTEGGGTAFTILLPS